MIKTGPYWYNYAKNKMVLFMDQDIRVLRIGPTQIAEKKTQCSRDS